MTMYRYVTLSWDRRNTKAARVAAFIIDQLPTCSPHAWEQPYEADGLVVLHSGAHKGRMQTYQMAGGNGVILGRLFKNGSDGEYSSQIDDLDDTETRRCLTSKTQYLIDNYWGRYVTFLHDRANDTKYVMRDPSGAFPCFVTRYQDVEIYFSDMQDAANLEFLPFTVNWDFIRANIMLPMFQKTITGLNEVVEVLPAECVEITPDGRTSRFVWDPTKIAATNVVEDVEEAAALLRKTVQGTIQALAGCYDSIIHNLGGLDSSIALTCMADMPKQPDITCINYYTKSPRGEERFYSRQMANKAGVPLVEAELDYRKADLTRIFHSNKLARPHGFFDCIGLTGDVLNLAHEKNAQAIFYGTGGDNVFFQAPLNLGALDYVHRHGFGSDTQQVWMEASRYGRKSLAQTFGAMLRERTFPKPCYAYVHNLIFADRKLPLINPELIFGDRHENLLHPLLYPDDGMAKGKYFHILCSALFPLEHYDHWDTDYVAERLRVYFTQPIIEACLRVPTWVLTHGGIDRGLARRAFQHDLPREVAMRRSKSTPGPYYNDIYVHNIELVRDVLLDGSLVRENVLLRDRLEQALSKGNISLHVAPSENLQYLATEAWLAGWSNRSMGQVAKVAAAE
jgi:asparagine synthase (glutamine-hydrolysing)